MKHIIQFIWILTLHKSLTHPKGDKFGVGRLCTIKKKKIKKKTVARTPQQMN